MHTCVFFVGVDVQDRLGCLSCTEKFDYCRGFSRHLFRTITHTNNLYI